MKNIFRFLMAVAVLFTASCAKEDISSSIGGGEVEVTFTANLPELGTRAEYGTGKQVNKLRYYVYDNNDTLLEGLSNTTTGVDIEVGKTTTVNLVLLKGMEYNILFWADNGSDIYSINGGVVSIDPTTEIEANDESRDAFYAALNNFDPASVSGTKDVNLTRPFAQLNAIVTNMAEVGKSFDLYANGAYIKSTIETTIYTSFDAFTGDVGGKTNAVIKFGETNVKDFAQGHLSMNYLLPPSELSEVTFYFEGAKFKTNTTINNIPLKANYKTNIIGKLLTASTDFEVTIDPVFDTPDKDIVQTAAELQQQIANAQDNEPTEIVLGSDINLNDLLASLGTLSTRAAATPSLTIPAGKNITLNLNGCTLSATENSTGSYALITNQGTLTISDSKGDGMMLLTATEERNWNAYSSVISNQPGGVLTVDGGTIEHLGGTAMAYGIDNLTNGKGTSAVATINGGTVKSTYRAVRQFLNGVEANNSLTINGGTIEGANKSIWMQDPSANANTGTLVISEDASLIGDVYLFVTAGSTEWPVNVTIANAALKNGATVLSGNVPEGYAVVEENGVWTVKFTHIANIGEQGYDSLKEAVAAVQDGETIVINRNYTFDKNNYTHNSGTYYDGLYYIGDKSFTIDLGGNTIGQNGAVNDYLLNFKNDGDKANTITLKNGTIDAGTAAYCALCTATASTQKITINLEGVNLVGNNSGGAVAKIRGGAELNVKTGTVITGNNNYVGIEAAGKNTVVNIYEGAKIYQKGTSSYVGSLAGASGGATINVYGGEGVSAKGGFIVMTSGGTVNISGGTWTANTDGTYANGNNSVLIAQSDKQYNAGATNSVVNVTGGTFKGGFNCYGNAVGDAQINISGGNFNANPSAYVVAGKAATENNGTWTIVDAVSTAEALVAALAQGGVVTLGANITVSEPVVVSSGVTATINLNGKTITGTMDKSVGHVLVNNGVLTVKNGTISSTAANGGSAIANYGELSIKEMTINGASVRENDGWPSYPINNYSNMDVTNTTINGYQGAIACNNEGTTTLVNCNIVKHYLNTSSHTFYINHSGADVIVHSGSYTHKGMDGSLAYVNRGSITVNGGTFTAQDGGYGMAALTNGKIVINGGEFINANCLNWGGTIEINGSNLKK